MPKHRNRHLDEKPGVLETIFTFGRATREWRLRLDTMSAMLASAEEAHREALRGRQQLELRQQASEADLSSVRHDLMMIRQDRTRLRSPCERHKNTYADAYPDDRRDGNQRELRVPWLDDTLDTARSELFLAALTLHQDFVANTAKHMLSGLRAATEVVAGSYPPHLEAAKLRAAWQLFFLVVPLVSTTFASGSRMFGGIGREAIGWLLIDEAGQACPQYAVGAIWRARRTVVVGDPLQLTPVVTIPPKAQRDIATGYGVTSTWIPPGASVQALADRIAKFGTILSQGEQEVWVSAPLRVHRRCDEPMFSLCNEIAYNGLMVNGVPLHRTGNINGLAPSHWAHEPENDSGSHLQPNQIKRFEKALQYLTPQRVPMSEVIAISPFRDVADRLAELAEAHPDLTAGTIHTAQGWEADVVILVLGGKQGVTGAKNWAASTPNLVNVAASRAKQRLYVIGDRSAWAGHNYFKQMSACLV